MMTPNIMARDDHSMSDFGDSGFVTFGGFVNGSRVNELVGFERNEGAISGDILDGGSNAEESSGCPDARASHSSCVYNDRLYVFGGQDDDNNKLGDLWEYDFTQSTWSQVKLGEEGSYTPNPRSGHTAVVWGTKMYIFGGILELTKELNDMIVFDFTTKQFSQVDQGDTGDKSSGLNPEK